jgi:hypothetical protein
MRSSRSENVMTWHKVTFLYKDCGIGTKDKQLQDAFGRILMENGGLPRDAALFSQRSEDFEYLTYYSSPSAMQIAGELFMSCGAVPCERPTESVRMAIGDVRARELLWPPASQKIRN